MPNSKRSPHRGRPEGHAFLAQRANPSLTRKGTLIETGFEDTKLLRTGAKRSGTHNGLAPFHTCARFERDPGCPSTLTLLRPPRTGNLVAAHYRLKRQDSVLIG